ncbi:hypothetical protein SAMN05660649_02208 [Desulfotomaculum arcticum]|uniref:Uncharacterized protein n=1 Tax=Desulfotruncus arcticus DSM 17038 TaxID=1121424 RepID=A0A1I2TEA4_9FIRM|nr:hypothetical protein [Desulfotruncus arcticus]SFG63283.1 hypothetical protein SAMN05660649_02208 [Desulfotomaculum arcticum] [Desulfotruncus arcticus DSM 17038]
MIELRNELCPIFPTRLGPACSTAAMPWKVNWDPYYGHPEATEKPLPPGTYIVEVGPPAGYKVLDRDGSVNTDQGDEFVSPPSLMRVPPPPYYPELPDISITKKLVIVVSGMNAAADFFLYTDVPTPGRIVGFLLDDVNLKTDPNFIYYGEKEHPQYTSGHP